jgi:hypothetical protein
VRGVGRSVLQHAGEAILELGPGPAGSNRQLLV